MGNTSNRRYFFARPAPPIGVRKVTTMTDPEVPGDVPGSEVDDAIGRPADAKPETPADAQPETIWDLVAKAFNRWRSGDQVALDDVVRTMSPVMWHVARAYDLNREAVEDVLQTTWLNLVKHQDTVRDAQALTKWLLTATRREAGRTVQAGRRHVPVPDDTLGLGLPEQRSAETEAVVCDESHRLWQAVAQLEPRCQRLLRLIAFDERPDYAALSVELDMPRGSIGPTRIRCLDKLRTTMRAKGES